MIFAEYAFNKAFEIIRQEQEINMHEEKNLFFLIFSQHEFFPFFCLILYLCDNQRQPPEVFYKKAAQRKTPVLESLFNKVYKLH